jgi:hypothetical protein
MKSATLLLVLGVAAGCASAERVPPPGMADADRPAMGLVPSPRVPPPPPDDLPESRRREWLEAQRPKRPVYRPVQVERVVVRERVPEYRPYDGWYDRRAYWYSPLALSLGWWGGHHGRHGWNWGLTWRDGLWCW